MLARAHGDETAYRAPSESLPRHGDIAGLPGAHEVVRGDAMTAAGAAVDVRDCHGERAGDRSEARDGVGSPCRWVKRAL